MPENFRRIVGLAKPILSNDFGVTANFHALCHYSVDFRGTGSSTATFAGYASREAFEAGKMAFTHYAVNIPKAPVSGDLADLPTWFVMELLAAAGDHDLVGATPVYAEPAPSVVFEQAVGPGDSFAVAHQGVGSGDEEQPA